MEANARRTGLRLNSAYLIWSIRKPRLRSLGSPDSRRVYQHAIDEFVAWYCSEPRLAFNKTVVLRYRFHLEDRGLAPGTINVRLAAVRRLAYEAADAGLLSPELAAGIHRIKVSASWAPVWATGLRRGGVGALAVSRWPDAYWKT